MMRTFPRSVIYHVGKYRFHNNTLLERKTETTLVLKDLRPEQAGEYYCRASGPSGAIKTKPATLKVIGK